MELRLSRMKERKGCDKASCLNAWSETKGRESALAQPLPTEGGEDLIT